jgi:phosphoribosylglycinamide formyltransferase-1
MIYNLAILASGTGSNAKAIIEYFSNHPKISVKLIASNKAHAGVLAFGSTYKIKTINFNKKLFVNEPDNFLDILESEQITHIILAGFLWKIPAYLIAEFPKRIINIHPSLLPKYGGKGMYGINVHKAVFEQNEKESGITIHLVDENYDTGKILFQKSVDISHCRNENDIASEVLKVEHANFPKVIEHYILGKSLDF